MDLVSFVAGGIALAVEARVVLRIVPAAGLQPFPPAAGLLRYQERLVAVFDLRPLTRDATHIVLIPYASSLIGLRAEGPPQHLNAPPAYFDSDLTVTAGLRQMADGTLLVADLGAALGTGRLHEAIAIADAVRTLDPQ